MSARQLQDLRDAGRGHLIDGSSLLNRADELRTLAKEEGPTLMSGNTDYPIPASEMEKQPKRETTEVEASTPNDVADEAADGEPEEVEGDGTEPEADEDSDPQ